jgi:hypothetical protein
MSDAASLGITPATNVAEQLGIVTNSVFPSASNAGFIGGLSANNTDLNVLSQLTPQVTKDFYTFNFEQGSNLLLSFNGTVGPLGDSNNDTPGSIVDATTLGLRYQLYDITGNLIADSDGTQQQQQAYQQLTSSGGLSVANGGYYVQVSAAPDTTISSQQNYNFQLYSGTTYNTSFVSIAQTQAYDPNLFVSAASTVSPVSSNINTYNQTATLSGTQASALNIGNLIANSTQLDASSTLDSQNSSAYYSFNFQQTTRRILFCRRAFACSFTTTTAISSPIITARRRSSRPIRNWHRAKALRHRTEITPSNYLTRPAPI